MHFFQNIIFPSAIFCLPRSLFYSFHIAWDAHFYNYYFRVHEKVIPAYTNHRYKIVTASHFRLFLRDIVIWRAFFSQCSAVRTIRSSSRPTLHVAASHKARERRNFLSHFRVGRRREREGGKKAVNRCRSFLSCLFKVEWLDIAAEAIYSYDYLCHIHSI